MSSQPRTRSPIRSQDGPREYATADEARAAITQLTPTDQSKLMVIAEIHCRLFGIPTSRMTPEDLLHEAYRRTLNLTKKWWKGITILYHLNRAMENIAGHDVSKAMHQVDLAETPGAETDYDEGDDPIDRLQKPRYAEGTVVAIVNAREDLEILQILFEDDPVAMDVLKCRARGQEGLEIQESLKLTQIEYTTISKRILRKTKSYYEPKS